MTPADDSAARLLLASSKYEPLWQAARRRLESNGVSLEGTPIKVDAPSPAEREAVCGLLGRSPTGNDPIRIRLTELDGVLRRGAANCGLVELLAEMGGPVRDRREERQSDAASRADVWTAVAAHPLLESRLSLQPWLHDIRRAGTATRLTSTQVGAGELILQALDVLAQLPADNIPLARLAATTSNDSHALDRGQPLGTLVAGALEYLDQEGADATTSLDSRSAPAYWWRRRWARQGVICDELSVSVLVLNLPVIGGDDLVADTIVRHRAAGEPLRLTLRQLSLGRLDIDTRAVVHVCENPAVLAQAATLLGARSKPLVCVDGQPNSAVDELLAVLSRSGATLRYHGDFDWGGLRIAQTIIERHGALPWRFANSDYQEVLDLSDAPLGPPPAGAASSWDPDLVKSMEAASRRVYEEQTMELLLTDLDTTG